MYRSLASPTDLYWLTTEPWPSRAVYSKGQQSRQPNEFVNKKKYLFSALNNFQFIETTGNSVHNWLFLKFEISIRGVLLLLTQDAKQTSYATACCCFWTFRTFCAKSCEDSDDKGNCRCRSLIRWLIYTTWRALSALKHFTSSSACQARTWDCRSGKETHLYGWIWNTISTALHQHVLQVHSCQQKSIGLKFSKSQTGSDVRYSCHHNSTRFTFPIFAHSCRFCVLHSLQSITPRIY